MEGDYHELIEKFGVENQCEIIEGLIYLNLVKEDMREVGVKETDVEDRTV